MPAIISGREFRLRTGWDNSFQAIKRTASTDYVFIVTP